MADGKVTAIYISPTAGGVMQKMEEIEATAGAGLEGDRYCEGQGSFNKNQAGRRQVTLINALFFKDSRFEYADSRRNIITDGVELMWLIGREFKIGEAIFKGVKYCDPCNRPSKLSNNANSFKDIFFDRGGLVAEIIQSGKIRTNDFVIPPPKGY
jgi:MOSC domain-containing protein YiiM